MRFLLLTVWALSVLTVSPLGAQTFEVTGVSSSDTLNMRANIDQAAIVSDAEIIGTIPSNGAGIEATGVSIHLNGTLWRKVTFRGTTGWVSSRFLKRTAIVEMPANLDCAGTEPFWSLQIRNEEAELNEPGLPEPTKLSLLAKRQGLNRSNLWSFYFTTEDKKSVLTGVLFHTDECTDGMSDLNYGFEIFLLGLRPGEGPAQGCCSFQR